MSGYVINGYVNGTVCGSHNYTNFGIRQDIQWILWFISDIDNHITIDLW